MLLGFVCLGCRRCLSSSARLSEGRGVARGGKGLVATQVLPANTHALNLIRFLGTKASRY